MLCCNYKHDSCQFLFVDVLVDFVEEINFMFVFESADRKKKIPSGGNNCMGIIDRNDDTKFLYFNLYCTKSLQNCACPAAAVSA
jgi:hypothetical protein